MTSPRTPPAVKPATGATIRSRAARTGGNKGKLISAWFTEDTLARIDALCEEGGISRSEWLREAARAYLILEGKDRLTDADWRKVVGG